MATFNLANRIKIVNANPNIDSDYGPHASVSDANIAIPFILRAKGKTVGIIFPDGSVVEHWWKIDLRDSGLIVKAAVIVIDSTPTSGSTNAVSSGGVFTALGTKENIANKGVANGYVPLNSSALIDSTFLPSYVDDVVEFANLAAFPTVGETGKLYVALDTSMVYRWSGSVYIEIVSGATWGGITGVLANQSDLQTALNAKQNNITVTANKGITLTGVALSTIYNTTIADSVNSVAVGGAPITAASILKTKSIVDLFDLILFPTILASISSFQSASLSLSGASGDYEIGTAITATLTAAFNRGSIVNGTGSAGPNLVGAVTASPYSFSGTSIGTPPTQSGNTFALSQNVVGGVNSWSVNVAYSIGTGAYTDNKGAVGTNLDSSRVAGSISANSSPNVTGYYKQFFGGSATPVTTSAGVRALTINNFSNVNSFQMYIDNTRYILAIPASKTIVSIITANFENITTNFTDNTATFNVLDAGSNPIPYKIFTFTSGTSLNLNAAVTLS